MDYRELWPSFRLCLESSQHGFHARQNFSAQSETFLGIFDSIVRGSRGESRCCSFDLASLCMRRTSDRCHSKSTKNLDLPSMISVYIPIVVGKRCIRAHPPHPTSKNPFRSIRVYLDLDLSRVMRECESTRFPSLVVPRTHKMSVALSTLL